MEEEGIWTVFCNNSECSQESGNNCSYGFSSLLNPYSCANHALIISVDTVLLSMLLFIFVHKSCTRKIAASSESQQFSPLIIFSAIFNSILGVSYFGLGLWIIYKKLSTSQAILPLHGWLGLLFQGFTWLLLGLSICIKKLHIKHIKTVKFCAVLAFLFAAFLCISSFWEAIADKTVSVNVVLEILSFPGSILLLFHAFRGQYCTDDDPEINGYESLPGDNDQETNDGTYYTLLQGEEADSTSETSSSNENVTPFANAKSFSRMSFWWLNPLMKKGKEKILEDEDIPDLRQADRAETCYSVYIEELSKQKHKESSETPTLLSVILVCHWRAILSSGFFALIKVIILSTGPLFLKAFINVAKGKESFKYEGYALTIGLFLAKCLESLAERQWYFQTRLVGLQVRSMLSAAIYKKQLRLSNAAKMNHSPGQIVNYVTVDAFRIGEFPYWFHQIWTSSLQLFLALAIVYYSLGLATVSALVAVILTVVASSPLVKLQHKYQTKLMMSQDERLMAITEALANMKILKLYAWETHFKKLIEGLRKEEFKCISEILLQKGYNLVLFWSSPILVSAVTFWTCYILGIQLYAANVFTFLASLRILQDPIRLIPDVAGVFIEAKVSLSRIVRFLEAPELENGHIRQDCNDRDLNQSITIRSTEISWETNSSLKASLRNVSLVVKPGEKVAICGEVGSGKSTLLAAVLGEVPKINGVINVYGKVAYVSQTAWIQTGTIQENILFGSFMDPIRYQEVLERCCLVEDLETLPFGDNTGIGERGVNLSGGQKQRVQLARALYQDADIYLLDDPFSAVDAHTATILFNEYVMGALSSKTVLLVTHQVDFLPDFNSILLMSAGEILRAATYDELLASSPEFRELVNAHNKAIGSERHTEYVSGRRPSTSRGGIRKFNVKEQLEAPLGDQLIKQEERETGDTGLKPYIQYLRQNKGFLYFPLAIIFHMIFVVGQLVQSYLLAVNLDNSLVSRAELITVFSVIGCILAVFLLARSFFMVFLGCGASESIFAKLLSSLFRAPMSFYDSTPLGRILSRVSSDLSIVDLEIPFRLIIAVGTTLNTYSSFIILGVLTWPVLFVIIPMIYLSVLLQKYYSSSAKELMRIGGTTKSAVASQLAESIAGAMTIRAFGEEGRFFLKYLNLIDANARPDFHSFSANEWLIQRLEMLCAVVLSSSALAMTLLPLGASSSGLIGMALSYGLSLNSFLVSSIQLQCLLANLVISVERLEQYMHIPSEAPEVIESNRPLQNWPSVGKVEIYNLKLRYRPNAPLVLQGISCIIEGGHKVGIVGRTGSGKSSLIASLFRLVEPTDGKIFIDDLNISRIGIHDLRSHLGIIPQDPTLFRGSVRYNLDPLSQHTDKEIWEVLEKCQLRETVQEKEEGLDTIVVQDGSNWSIGQRQLFCLGRALLKRSRILVLDEATASMDNATDFILQKTIRTVFADCTVLTVAHRIPTVMDCNMVLAISDGKLVEYDEPLKLVSKEGSLFGRLVNEYWSHSANASAYSED